MKSSTENMPNNSKDANTIFHMQLLSFFTQFYMRNKACQDKPAIVLRTNHPFLNINPDYLDDNELKQHFEAFNTFLRDMDSAAKEMPLILKSLETCRINNYSKNFHSTNANKQSKPMRFHILLIKADAELQLCTTFKSSSKLTFC